MDDVQSKRNNRPREPNRMKYVTDFGCTSAKAEDGKERMDNIVVKSYPAG